MLQQTIIAVLPEKRVRRTCTDSRLRSHGAAKKGV